MGRPTRKTGITLDKAIDLWLVSDEVAGWAPNTQRNYKRVAEVMKELRVQGVLPRDVGELDPIHMSLVIQTLKKGRITDKPRSWKTAKPRSPQSLNIDRAVLRGFARFLLTSGYHGKDVACQLRNAKRARLKPWDDISLSDQEADALVRAADLAHPQNRVIVALGLFVGMRESEIREVRVRDVNLEERRINFARQKQRGARLPSALGEAATYELDLYLKWYEEWYGPLDPSWYLVPPRKVGATREEWVGGLWPLVPSKKASSFRRPLRRLLDVIEKPPAGGQGMHMLRRTLGNALYKAGAPLLVIQEQLGHEDSESTLYYLDIRERAKQHAEYVQNPKLRLPGQQTPTGDNIIPFHARHRRTG